MIVNGSVAGVLAIEGEGADVTVTQILSSGTKIATITINEGKEDEQVVDLYAPTPFSGSYNDLTDKPDLFSGSYNDLTDKPTIPNITSGLDNPSGGNNGDIYFKLHVNDTPVEHDFSPTWSPSNSWHEVDNPYYEGFVGYSGTFTFQGNSSTVSKTAEQIPVYNSTVQNDPGSYKFWAYSAYKWCSIARSADNKKLYFYDNAGNASYTNQKILTQSDEVDGYSGIYYNYNGVWLTQVS